MQSETDRLSLKLLRRDKIALQALANQNGESLSVFVRRILRDELKRRKVLHDREGGKSKHAQSNN